MARLDWDEWILNYEQLCGVITAWKMVTIHVFPFDWQAV
jgi:hypothetical protein